MKQMVVAYFIAAPAAIVFLPYKQASRTQEDLNLTRGKSTITAVHSKLAADEDA